jgi:hypothetical protein
MWIGGIGINMALLEREENKTSARVECTRRLRVGSMMIVCHTRASRRRSGEVSNFARRGPKRFTNRRRLRNNNKNSASTSTAFRVRIMVDHLPGQRRNNVTRRFLIQNSFVLAAACCKASNVALLSGEADSSQDFAATRRQHNIEFVPGHKNP